MGASSGVPRGTSARASLSGLRDLAERYGLGGGALDRLSRVARVLQEGAPSGVVGQEAILERHIADSLVAIEVLPFDRATRAIDIGTGAGVPGGVLAAALDGVRFDLMDSNSRKAAFARRFVDAADLRNAEVVTARAEEWARGPGGERYDLALARAVAPLAVVLEYAAPLLRLGGRVAVWRGMRHEGQEEDAMAAAAELGLELETVSPVEPFAGAEHRHIHVYAKRSATPPRFPRRPGRAAKKPLSS